MFVSEQILEEIKIQETLKEPIKKNNVNDSEEINALIFKI